MLSLSSTSEFQILILSLYPVLKNIENGMKTSNTYSLAIYFQPGYANDYLYRFYNLKHFNPVLYDLQGIGWWLLSKMDEKFTCLKWKLKEKGPYFYNRQNIRQLKPLFQLVCKRRPVILKL